MLLMQHCFVRTSLLLALAGGAVAQYPGLTLPPSGNNQKAAVTQYLGPVKVTIEYSSPAVHGPGGVDRRGQIWGKLVPFGMTNLGFGTAKVGPWRAGANENTVFGVSDPVTIEGQILPAGRYGLHMIAGPEKWTVIFSRNSEAWGSFFYDPNEDALRVDVTPRKHDYREWLTYEFTTRKPDEATAELQWEELAVPWTIKVPNANEIFFTHLRHELTSVPGFSPEGYDAGAQYLLQSGTHLNEALKWADAAIHMPFVGQSNFNTLNLKAQVLSKLGRDDEAQALMVTALKMPGTTPVQLHQYGRQLLDRKKNADALKIFQLNAERNGDVWPIHAGLARGYAAVGDNAKALEHARIALTQAPDPQNKANFEAMIQSLAQGKSLN